MLYISSDYYDTVDSIVLRELVWSTFHNDFKHTGQFSVGSADASGSNGFYFNFFCFKMSGTSVLRGKY